MLPVLLRIGPVKVYSYGLFFFLGLFFGLYWWWKMGRDEHLEERQLFDAYFLGLFVYYVFARIGYVVLRGEGLGSLRRILGILAYPGLIPWFGVLGAGVFLWLFARDKEWRIWRVLDIFVVALSVIVVFVSLGGFLNGANPGIMSKFLGVSYTGFEGKVVPVDLASFVLYVFVLGVVSRVRKNFRFYSWYKADKSEVHEGLAFLVFLGFSGLFWVGRSFIDRGFLGQERGQVWMRWVGGGVVLLSVILAYVFSGRDFEDDFGSFARFWKKVFSGKFMVSLKRRLNIKGRRKK